MAANTFYNKQRGWMGLTLMCCFLSATSSASAVLADKKPSQQALVEYAKQALRREYAWFNAPWTDNDRPYADLRHRIEQEFAGRQKPADVLQKYKTMAMQKPTDPQAVFAYVYAAYGITNIPNATSSWDQGQELDRSFMAWDRISAPHTYNYARCVFLRNSLSFPDPNMAPVGKRLLARDSRDYVVEFYLAAALNASRDASERAQAVTYQQDLARRFPDDPRQYLLLGTIHSTTGIRSHSQSEVGLAIAAYQHYLGLLSPTQGNRMEVDNRILFLRQLQAQWKLQG